MYRRTARLAATFLVGVMAAVVMPLALTAAPAAAEEQFTLDLVEGELVLRDSEPYVLESPTTLSGTNTDGQLTGVTFATPQISIQQEITDPVTATVFIDADFAQVTPGSGTGSIDSDGNVLIQTALKVDLHIEVLGIEGDCPSSPVNLTFQSTSPYDGERVTLQAPNFSIPPVSASATCNSLFVGPLNDALAGAGHALTLTMAGTITPPAAGEPTATSLVVTPADGARVGTPVTLTATVVPDPEVPGAPAVSGIVTFFDGATSLGTAPVEEDGAATLVTTDLPAGPRQLRGAYGGSPPDWNPSSSAVVDYTVTANPAVVTTAAGDVRVGGDKDFDVTVVNTGFGGPLDGARLEVQLNRQTGNGTIAPVAGVAPIGLSRVVDDVATPVPLTYQASPAPARYLGTVGDPATWLVPPGEEHTEALRLTVADGVGVGPLDVTFTLVTGEGAARTVLATTSGVIALVNEARQETAVESGSASIVPITPVVRQGNVAELRNLRVTPVLGNVHASGTFTFALDGVPVRGQHSVVGQPGAFTWLESVPRPAAAQTNVLVEVPPTTPTGTRVLTVSYSGDGLYAPAQASFPFTVEPSIGAIYACRQVAGIGAGQTLFAANVEVQATLPAVWPAGQDLPLDRVQARLRLSRTNTHANLLSGVTTAPEANRDWSLGLGPDGVLTAASVTTANQNGWAVGQVGPIDHLIDLTGVTGTIEVSPTPGDPVAYTLDRIALTAVSGPLSLGFECTPDATPYTVGTITPAGTTLAVDPAGPVGPATPVTLTAAALPAAAGVVEFRDGTRTVGVVPVDSAGGAQVVTTLPAGTRSLTARFFGAGVNGTPSPPVEVRVVGDCGAHVDPGNGAAVRLVYIELLDRCPDAAGYAFWTERLDSGAATREQFALEISKSLEARGVIVDDGYRTILDRAAEPAGRDFWARRLATGRFDDLLADLASSPESWAQAGGTNAGFVDLVYQRILRRPAEPEGLAYWTDRLDAGQSRRRLVLTLFNLPEPLGVVVGDAYTDLLDRAPTAEERAAGVTLLRSTSDRSRLYAVVIDTDDFFTRAQDFPERTP